MPVLGVTVIAPVMPEMGRHFSDTPGSDVLIPLVLTFPALFLALAAPFAGLFADKFDRKRLLLFGMVGYAVVAPRRATSTRSSPSPAAGYSWGSAKERS